MTGRQRASTVDNFRRPQSIPVKIKKEEGVVVKTEPGTLLNFPRSSSCSPGDLIRGDKKYMSSIARRVRSLLRPSPSFRRPATPSRQRSISRPVSASPAPSSTASIATNTTSGLRLDFRPPVLPSRRNFTVDTPTIVIDDEDEDDENDNISIASRASTIVNQARSQNKIICYMDGGWPIEINFESGKVSDPAVATATIRRELRKLGIKFSQKIADRQM